MGLDEVSFLKEKPARSGFENGFVQSLPSQCVDVGPRLHPIAPGSSQWQRKGGGAAARGQCTGGCAKQWWPGASVQTRLVSLLLARDRLSWDRNLHLFCAEKSFVNIVALRMALFKDSNGIYWWFRHDQKVFPWAQPRWSPLWGETPLDIAREEGKAEVAQLLEAVTWPHGRSSDSPPLQMLAPRPGPLHRGPNEGRMLREFYAMFCQSGKRP